MPVPIAPPPEQQDRHTRHPRSPWRQRLVDVERGVTLGVRRDSTFFVHFFSGSIVIAAALVLGLPLLHWILLVMALTIVLTAEMFQQVLKTILESLGHHFPESARRAERIGTAGVFVAILGTVVTIGLIFAQRLVEVFGP